MAKTLILLSLKPQHWQSILTGQKKYEYRKKRSFPHDSVQAYIYLSSPRMETAGFVDFDKPIIRSPQELATLAESQVPDSGQRVRKYFGTQTQGFAIPIISYETFDSIPLHVLRERFNFQPPQSYLVLDNQPKLRDFIQAWHRDGAR